MKAYQLVVLVLFLMASCGGQEVSDFGVDDLSIEGSTNALQELDNEEVSPFPDEDETGSDICQFHPSNVVTIPGLIGQSISKLTDNTYAIVSSGQTTLFIVDGNLNVLFRGNLTINGVAIALNHPVGLAYREGYPTFVGGLREIYWIDWNQFLKDGTLDNAVIRVIKDKMALEYSRVEYVDYQGKVALATGDYYSPDGTRLRLLDPLKLITATSTGSGEPGLWLRTYVVGDYIQSYAYADGYLYIARNIQSTITWAIDKLNLTTGEITKFHRFTGTDNSELEGFQFGPDGKEFYLTGDVYPEGGQIWYENPAPLGEGSECNLN